MNERKPKVFISYSWEDDEHKKWVKELTDKLINDGINATLDQYDLQLGDRLTQFMEQQIIDSDYVLIICTPEYKQKSDRRTSGVGYENHIISDELFSKGNERKFIPVLQKGTIESSMPNCLAGKLAIDLSDSSYDDQSYRDLVTTIYGARRKPYIGKTPLYISNISNPKKSNIHDSTSFLQNDAPVKILGIITNEVTVPKMDGTKGSALYKIPFRLSKCPSELWISLFLKAWQFPPSFTTMHRPGIASVYGDEIILDGTTIEEVQKYHRNTLILCVDEANKQELQMIDDKNKAEDAERKRKEQHFHNVAEIANKIKFRYFSTTSC